jgi:hypothetical protein
MDYQVTEDGNKMTLTKYLMKPVGGENEDGSETGK